MPDVTINLNIDAARLEKAIWASLGTAGVGRSCEELERLYQFLRSTLPDRDAARAFDGQLSRLERLRVKGRIRMNWMTDGMVESILARAMAMMPLDTGALKSSITGQRRLRDGKNN